ncbi:uncharacterized protein LOC129581175 [Paramacrobiotus metropolitanus]|uniref:uncharacterized protein LOC129581175 n=1 Tax=Paramacrobiotus metropolitanus TaxID=2943436 RepID=UPI0024458501|nr:uncharacterized protein LOC129581175 [Paramacrobiotus metropolitanus]
MTEQEMQNGGNISPDPNRAPGITRLFLAANTFAQVGPLHNENFVERTASDAQIMRLNISKVANEGLGFSIIEGPEKNGIYVAYVLEDTSARLNGLLPNDEILEVNDEIVTNMDRHAAAVWLRSLPPGPVTLKVRRAGDIYSESLWYYLAKHHGLTGGSNGMYEVFYGAVAVKSPRPPLDRGNSRPDMNHSVSHMSVPSVASANRVQDNGSATANKNGGVVVIGPEPRKQNTDATDAVTAGKFPTRLASVPYFIVFAIEALAGLAIIIIECVTGGLFARTIGGEEYAGIYVGAFGIATGVTGLVCASIKVAQDYELKLNIVNMVMNIICMVQSLILCCATAALLAYHVRQQREYVAAQSAAQNATVTTTGIPNNPEVMPGDISALIGLKSTALVLYFILFVAACAFLILLTSASRRRSMSSRSLRFMRA